MAQISKGDTFSDGQQLTATRLNQLVDSATLTVGAITDQSAITAATVASDDLVIISDTSTSSLKKATVNDLLGSSLPVVASTVAATTLTTSVVNAEANKDIVITPNDGANVTGKTFSSANGITATVASTAHGLTTGQNVTITASNSAYSGTYKIIVTTVDAFTYTVYPTTTAASGSCSYVREGTVSINGELNLSSGLNVVGASKIDGNIVVNGSFISNGSLTYNGTANFTGALQINGAVGYVLTEIFEETMSPWTAPSTGAFWGVYTSSAFTKPVDEIWVFEVVFNYKANVGVGGAEFAGRYGSVTQQTGPYIFHDFFFDSQGGATLYRNSFIYRWTASSSTTFTSETFKIDAYNGAVGLQLFHTGTSGHTLSTSVTPSKLRIYKYKTA